MASAIWWLVAVHFLIRLLDDIFREGSTGSIVSEEGHRRCWRHYLRRVACHWLEIWSAHAVHTDLQFLLMSPPCSILMRRVTAHQVLLSLRYSQANWGYKNRLNFARHWSTNHRIRVLLGPSHAFTCRPVTRLLADLHSRVVSLMVDLSELCSWPQYLLRLYSYLLCQLAFKV